MLNRFLITAATAALVAGTGCAYAQGTGPGKEPPSGMQQNAPSSGAEHGMKSSQTGEKEKISQGAQNQRSQEMKSGGARDEKSAQETGKGDKSKSTQYENKGAAGKDMKAEGREDRSMKGEGREDRNMKAEGREDRDRMKAEGRENREGMKAEGREGREMKGEGREGRNAAEGGRIEGRTTGQAGAGARLTTEQRTRISTVIRDQHVAPVGNVNFSVAVGTRVPREIGFHPLPAEIITIYPEWRGYEFFLVRDEIIVVDPRTLEIVAILPA